MRRFLTAKGLLGAALVIAMVLVAIVAPLVIPADYGTRMTMTARLRPPSELHWLGTDQLGRDLFYRVMLGARTSLGIAGAAVLMSLVLGLPIGMAAGFYRGGIDNALMRLVDTLLSFPVLLLALTISAMLGPSIPNAIIAIGVAFTPFLARIVRGEALRVTQMPYVEAARAAGATEPQSYSAARGAQCHAAHHCPGHDQSRFRRPCRGQPLSTTDLNLSCGTWPNVIPHHCPSHD